VREDHDTRRSGRHIQLAFEPRRLDPHRE
jgi:hypothetical protein